MSAHPWLTVTPWPTTQLPREELTARIEHLLATHWMGVLCTTGKNGPIGSPVEYYADGLVTYVLPQPGSPKIVYTEQWLRKDGFGPRQIWNRDPAIKGQSLRYGH